jgi:phage terminase large subunit-like protein
MQGDEIRPVGRPRLSEAELRLRGTWRRDRHEPATMPQERRPETGYTLSLPPRHFAALAASYTAEVASGKVTAGKWTRLACQRQERDLKRSWDDPTWPYVWDRDAVQRVCEFVERLPHVEGQWPSPTLHLEPAQVFLLGCLFGWRQKADPRLRRFTTLYWELGRKGAKSTLMAAIALYHLLEEGEPGPHVICGATTGSQARIVFDIAAAMVKKSPWLRERGLMPFQHSIRSPDGWMKPINAKASTQDGLNPSAIILDESHAQDFALHDVLKSAQGARANPLLLCPTTAGYDLLSVGYALRTTMAKILEGVYTNEHFLGVIYSLDEGDDWRDERLWVKANPMLGIAPRLDQVRRQCLDAQQTPALEAEFRVKCCSEWQNAASTWLSMAAWDRCADANLTLERFFGRPAWIGGDLAARDDLASIAIVIEDEGRLVAFVRCYLPADVVSERARAVPEYRLWRERGEIVVTDGSMIDYTLIEGDIRAWTRQFQVKDICFDQYGSWQLTGRLFNDGLPARTEPKNAKTCTPPARELEARVTHGRFRHDGNSCLRWQASNVVVMRGVDDSLVPKKEHAISPLKIDAIDALLWAIGGWLRTAQTPTPDYSLMVVG